MLCNSNMVHVDWHSVCMLALLGCACSRSTSVSGFVPDLHALSSWGLAHCKLRFETAMADRLLHQITETVDHKLACCPYKRDLHM